METRRLSTSKVVTTLQQESKAVPQITLFELPPPASIWVAPDLTSPYVKRDVVQRGDKHYVDIGVGTKREVEWKVKTTISPGDLRTIKNALASSKKLPNSMVELTEDQYAAVKKNLIKTRDKIGYRYQGEKYGLGAFVRKPTHKGDCVPGLADLAIRKDSEVSQLSGSKSDYTMVSELAKEKGKGKEKDKDSTLYIASEVTSESLDAGYLIQYAPNTASVSETEEREKLYTLKPSEITLANITVHNSNYILFLFRQGDKFELFPVFRLTTNLEEGDMLGLDYGEGYLKGREVIFDLFSRKGKPLDESQYDKGYQLHIAIKDRSLDLGYISKSNIDNRSPTMCYRAAGKDDDKMVLYTKAMLQHAYEHRKNLTITIDSPQLIFYADNKVFARAMITELEKIMSVKDKECAWLSDGQSGKIRLTPISAKAKLNLTYLCDCHDELRKKGFHPDSLALTYDHKGGEVLEVNCAEVYNRLVMKLPIPSDQLEFKQSNATGVSNQKRGCV